ARIPRLESVSNIVLYQDKCFDGSGFPNNSVAGTKIPLGSRILKVLSDLIELESEGGTRVKAIKQLQVRRGWYDPQVMKKVSSLFLDEEKEAMEDSEPSLFLPLKELRPGQIILSDIKAENGLLLLAAGHEISMIQLARLRNHAKLQMIQEPIEIKCKPGKTG
ncbi:MAG: HD domain-containing phosphohydrolase, partial [Nitrospinales bacterium]